MRLTLHKPKDMDISGSSGSIMLGCLFLVILMFTLPIAGMGLLLLFGSLNQLLTNTYETIGQLVQLVIMCLVGIGMTGIGPIIFLMIYEIFNRTSLCSFDRKLGVMTIQHSGTLLSRLFRSIRCSLREIVDVQVEEKKISSEDGSYMSYKIVLVLTSSKRIPIPSNSGNREASAQLSEFIKTFLYLNK